MKRNTLFCAEIEYDDELTDWGKIAELLSRSWPPKSVRGLTVKGMLSLEHGVRLTIADECQPAGDSDAQDCITLEMRQTPFGVDLHALNAFGQRFAAVSIDYFDNRLRALAWGAFDDEPVSAQVICADVRKAVGARIGSELQAGSNSPAATAANVAH